MHSGSKWAQAYTKIERLLANPFYIYGLLVLFIAVSMQWWTNHGNAIADGYWVSSDVARILLCSATALVIAGVSILYGSRINSSLAHRAIYLILPTLYLTGLLLFSLGGALLGGWAGLFWLCALVLSYFLLYRAQASGQMSLSVAHVFHAASVWLMALLFAQTLAWYVTKSSLNGTAWAAVIGLVAATLILIALSFWASGKNVHRYPLANHQLAYLWLGALPIAVAVLFGVVLIALGSSGNTQPLPYVPLLNPTDLSVVLGLVALVFWRMKLRVVEAPHGLMQMVISPSFWRLIALLGFLLINTIWLRIAHHFFDVPWNVASLFDSYIVQTGYAILWSLLSMAIMFLAHKRSERTLWMVGAVLLGLTVFKLVLIDLANTNGFERIIAFITVGVMMLVIGYIAPLPSNTNKTKSVE